jgi:uncharacterized membrane protein (DUF4010 family)
MPSFLEFTMMLLSAAGLAGLIGMEREMRIQDNKDGDYPPEYFSGGLRSHAMVGSLGFLIFFVAENFSQALLLPLVVGVFFIFLITHYMISQELQKFGMSSSLSLLASFIIGIFVAKDQMIMGLLISLLFTIVLVLKDVFHGLARRITPVEFFAIVKFLILSFIVLQILPESWLDPLGFFDWRPQTIWLMVMLVASIRFVGYFLSKFIGQEKSTLLSGIVGGLVSSTAVTTSLAQESKHSKKGNIFIIPILVASSIMFFRVILEILLVSKSKEAFTSLYVSFGVMGILCLVIAAALHFGKKKDKKIASSEIMSVSQPLHLKSALSFGLFFLVILILSEKIGEYFSEQSLLLVGAIAGLTDVDAITLAMAQSEMTSMLPLSVIFVAVIVNTLVKIGIVATFGSKKVLKKLSIYLGIVLIAGVGSFVAFLL